MRIKTSIASLAVASLIATSPLIMLDNVSAAETTAAKDAVAKVTTEVKDQEIIKTVDEAYKGLREVRAARLAIFNGETDVAVKFTSAAEQDFIVAEKSIQTHQVATKIATKTDENYIPFNMSINMSEGFVSTKEQKVTLNKANGFLGHGNHRKAVEVLRLANIEVTVNMGLIPANASLAHVKDALKLLDEKKFYEANLALKAVEDSVLLESYSVETVPEQGNKS